MRDKNQSFIQFKKSVEAFVKRKFAKGDHQFLTTAVAIDPTFLEDFTIRYPRKFKETFNLVVHHYYLNDSVRWRMFLDLEEMSFSHFTKKQILILRIMLSSKENMLKFLYFSEQFSSNALFGIIGQPLSVTFIRKSTNVVKPKRKRGYDDKGSRRPDDRWLPSHDYTFNELQIELNNENLKHKRILDRLLSILEKLD